MSNQTPKQLADLARFMGLDEVAILAGIVFYLKPTYEFPAIYDPRTNPKQSQALQERLKIAVRPNLDGWVAGIDTDEMFSQVRGETIRGAIINVALQYIKRYQS